MYPACLISGWGGCRGRWVWADSQGLQAMSFRLSGPSFRLFTKRAMTPPWQPSREEYRRYDVGHACHTGTQPPPLLFFFLQPATTPAWHFLVLMYRVSGKRVPFSSQGCPPFPPVPDPRPTGFHPKPLSAQTQTAGVTPGLTFMLSLFSCSKVFENL